MVRDVSWILMEGLIKPFSPLVVPGKKKKKGKHFEDFL